VHDLTSEDLEHTVVIIENGHITDRRIGDGPSHIVLESLRNDTGEIRDHYNYLSRTHDGRVLKSSTVYVRDENGKPIGIFSINYDITSFVMAQHSIESLLNYEKNTKEPEYIPRNVNDLLDDLIGHSVKVVGKPVALMTKDDKIRAMQYLNDAGAFLITKSGDKIAKYFGISKYTLYSYLDAKNI
jgi:predicted transcriptional regulator YheO